MSVFNTPFVPIAYLWEFPEFLYSLPGGKQTLYNVGIKEYIFDKDLSVPEFIFDITLLITGEIKFGLPLVDSVEFVFNADSGFTEVQAIITVSDGSGRLELPSISPGIRFKTDLLKPVKKEGDKFVPIEASDGVEPYYQIDLDGLSLSADTAGNIDFGFAAGAPSIDLKPVMIGDSGVVVEAENITFVFSRQAADSIPSISPTARGIYIESATIHLPEGLSVALPDDVQLEDFFIGSGGISGSVSGIWEPQLNAEGTAFTGNGAGELFGIPFALREVGIEFKQNTLVKGTIKGVLILPFFDQPVLCEIGLTNSGDFTVALAADQVLPAGVPVPASTSDGLFVFRKEELMELTLKNIAFEKKDGVFTIALGGNIKPLFGGMDWPEVEVKALSIDSNGKVKIEGGWIEIPRQKAFTFYGFKVELTRIGFGTDDSGYRCIGLSGGIQIVEGLPMKGGVDGLKILWKGSPVTGDLDVRFEISGIKVAFEVENVMKFAGEVYFINEPHKKGIKGGVKMLIYPLDGLMLDVQFMAGRNSLAPPYNFFYLFMGVELPVGIPLAQSGASLYGMAGLFGYNVLPDKRDNEAWFENDDGSNGYYLRDEVGITSATKWTDSRDSLALGAGITLGTADSGFTFAGKVLLVILIPGPMILIEGKAQFLQSRQKLEDDAIFRMLAVLDAKAGTFLLNIQARYKFPDGGEVIDISALAEAYFNFNNPAAWHLYLGKDTPEAKRIRADILKIFKANAYFMIDNKGVLMGFWIGYKKNWKFGPLSVKLEAWIEGALGLNRMPIQAYGKLVLHGDVQLRAFGVGLGLTVVALLEARTPKPFLLKAKFKVKLNLPWPLPDPKATIKLKWQSDGVPDVPLPLAKIGIEHPKVSETWELVKYPDYDTEGDGFEGGFNSTEPSDKLTGSPIVPADVMVSLSFAKPVKDEPLVGAETTAGTPSPEKAGKYEFKYTLKKISLHHRRKDGPSTWVEVAPSEVKGKWQVVEGDSPKNMKLLLRAYTPFDLTRQLDSNSSWLGTVLDPDGWRGYPCNVDVRPGFECVDFEELNVKDSYHYFLVRDDCLFLAPAKTITVVSHNAPWAGTTKAITSSWSKKPAKPTFLNIQGQRHATNLKSLAIDNVVFKAGISTDGKVFPFEVRSKEQNNQQRSMISINWSGESLIKKASINFPLRHFNEAPDKVILSLICQNGGVKFEAFDGKGNQVAFKEHLRAANIAVTLDLEGKDIRSITVTGSEILIAALGYEYTEAGRSASSISIMLPEEKAEAKLYLSKRSKGILTAYDTSNNILFKSDFLVSTENPVEVASDKGSIHSIQIEGDFKLLKICSIDEEEEERLKYNERLLSHRVSTIEEWWENHDNPLLEPNSFYKITVETETSFRKSGNWTTRSFSEHSYFQTGNPPGAWAPDDLPVTTEAEDSSQIKTEHYPYEGPLRDLSAYIKETVPPATVSNEAQTPVYRSYDIGVLFNEEKGYVEEMFLMAGLNLNIKLFDNNDEPVADVQGNPVELTNRWSENTLMMRTREEKQWRMVLNESLCGVELDEKDLSDAEPMYAGSKDLLLEPRSLYRAHLCGGNFKVFSFSFITSEYATFIHHIHSFNDIAWDHHKLYGTDGIDLLDTGSKAALNTHLAAFALRTTHAPDNYSRNLEAIAYEDIHSIFFNAPRSLPERIEISILNDETRSYGLLLESPEPIDWKRVTVSLKRKADNHILEEARSDAKIIEASIGAGSSGATSYNDEYVDILLREKTDLSGLTVTHKPLSAPEERELKEYYTFGNDAGAAPAGTVIRIHSGSEPAGSEPAGECRHFYLTPEGDATGWQFNPLGEVVVLLDSSGKALNSRLVAPFTNNRKKFRIVRNRDMTRAFIFFESGTDRHANIPHGRLTFLFTFHREVDGMSPLMRMGSKDDELTRIEFSLPAALPE